MYYTCTLMHIIQQYENSVILDIINDPWGAKMFMYICLTHIIWVYNACMYTI